MKENKTKENHGGNWWEVHAEKFPGDKGVEAHCEGPVLWELKKPDPRAVALEESEAGWDAYFKAYPDGPTFVIGSSEPVEFPFVMPRPFDDMVVGHAGLTTTIQFGVAELNATEGEIALELDFMQQAKALSGMLNLKLNGRLVSHFLPDRPARKHHEVAYSQGTRTRVIKLPAEALQVGNNRLEINHLEGGWLWFERLALYAGGLATCAPVVNETLIEQVHFQPALLAGPKNSHGRAYQPLRLSLYHFGPSIPLEVVVDEKSLCRVNMHPGVNNLHDLKVDPVDEGQISEVKLLGKNGVFAAVKANRQPVRHLDLHLVHHTHLDIGYTHSQEEVLECQLDHFRKVLEYIRDADSYPTEARLRWHPEGMWALDEFLRRATEEEKQALIRGVRDGYIHIDALFAQPLTALHTEEELIALFESAGVFSKVTGVPVVSMQMTDIPGITWGLLSVLAQYGIRYICLGPNPGHRIGLIRELDDKPFYWESPDGKSRVLMLVPGLSYNHWHWKPVGHRIQPDEVFPYVDRLANSGYRFDRVLLRYNIEKDNGGPNPALPKAIQAWNEKYLTPKMISDTNSGYLQAFEKKYGQELPVVSGDLTPYWEDGAASTAHATAVNRSASEKIAQAQILWSLLNRSAYPYDKFDTAWDRNLLFDEHTWGAWCSILQPDNPFTINQDAYKQKLAFDAYQQAGELIAAALAQKSDSDCLVVSVFNTASWPVTQMVLLSAEQSRGGDLVGDTAGGGVPSQRLASGELAFRAVDVPAFGCRRYTVKEGKAAGDRNAEPVVVKGRTLKNGLLELEVSALTGGICRMHHRASGRELVDSSKANELNGFVYIVGRSHDEKQHQRVKGPVRISVEDAGPLVGTVVIESDAPGCERLIRKIRLEQGSAAVFLTNLLDKKKELEPEGAFFSFPLNIPDSAMMADTPYAVVEVEKQQLPQANRNFMAVQRWVDVSNEDVGVTWVTVDAPLIQFDPIRFTGSASSATDARQAAAEWRRRLEPGASFFSWVMSNHWETNYKAYQDETCTFRYILKPHAGPFRPEQAQRAGRECCQPLLVATGVPDDVHPHPILRIPGDDVVVTSIKPTRDGRASMVRLFNVSGKTTQPMIEWANDPQAVYISNPMEEELSRLDGPMSLAPQEVVTLKIL